MKSERRSDFDIAMDLMTMGSDGQLVATTELIEWCSKFPQLKSLLATSPVFLDIAQREHRKRMEKDYDLLAASTLE